MIKTDNIAYIENFPSLIIDGKYSQPCEFESYAILNILQDESFQDKCKNIYLITYYAIMWHWKHKNLLKNASNP